MTQCQAFTPVDHVQAARNYKKQRQAFYSPLSLVGIMVDTANHWHGCRVLEPSAGDGRIVFELLRRGLAVDVCEVDDAMRARCAGMGASVVAADFLSYNPSEPYDLIVMNPPFTRGQDKRHIEHAWSMLAEGGEVVAISSPAFAKHLQERTAALPGCEYAVYERLGRDVFKESGTGIETLLVTLKRHAGQEWCGFSNHATYNASVTIESDRELSSAARRFIADSGDFAARFSPAIAESGGSCYGVRWPEVIAYLRGDPDADVADPGMAKAEGL